MKFPKRCPLWKMAATGYIRRPALEHVWLDGNYLVATDGYAMVCVPVTSRLARDADGPIPVDAVKAAIDAAEGDDATILCLKTKVRVGDIGYSRPQDVKGVDWRKALALAAKQPIARIQLNASLLKRAMLAMGESGYSVPVTLEIYGDDKTVIARPTRSDVPDSVGVVMLMRIDDEWVPLPDELTGRS